MRRFEVIYESTDGFARTYNVTAESGSDAWMLAEQNCTDLVEVIDVFEI